MTIYELFRVPAVKRGGEWVKWTYAQYLSDVYTAAKAFISVRVFFFMCHFPFVCNKIMSVSYTHLTLPTTVPV